MSLSGEMKKILDELWRPHCEKMLAEHEEWKKKSPLGAAVLDALEQNGNVYDPDLEVTVELTEEQAKEYGLDG